MLLFHFGSHICYDFVRNMVTIFVYIFWWHHHFWYMLTSDHSSLFKPTLCERLVSWHLTLVMSGECPQQSYSISNIVKWINNQIKLNHSWCSILSFNSPILNHFSIRFCMAAGTFAFYFCFCFCVGVSLISACLCILRLGLG